MSNEEQIEELKRYIEEEKEARRVKQKANVHRVAAWQKTNKTRRNRTTRTRLRAIKEELVARKGGKCADCGGVFPAYVYDFHHVTGKDRKINSLVSNLTRTEMLAEIDKCVLLCANCHRGRHVISEAEE
jgi:5-methylcytosine-specific restriction endonuclease McrA